MSERKDQKNPDRWIGIVKWIVIGVIFLIFLYMFKEQVGRLIDRVTGINISKEGIAIKTAETPIGTTTVSNVPLKTTGTITEGIHGTTYVSNRYKFQISWPGDGKWSASETMGKTLHRQLSLPAMIDIPIVIQLNESFGNFRPNINVLVEQNVNLTINQYMDSVKKQFQQMGWIIISSDIDEEHQSGLMVFLNTSYGTRLYQFQRYVISSGNVYIVTASQLPPEDMFSQQLREELRSIINSFRLII